MKIDRFKAQIDDLQRLNRYNVAMFGTGSANSGLAVRGIRCETANMPGRGFFTVEESEYGPKRVIPHKPQYDQFDCSFYLTNDQEDRELIELWQGTMNTFADGSERSKGDSKKEFGSGGKGMFHSRFHDEYTGVIYLEQLDKYNNVNYRCIMVDAFPVQLAQMSFGYASSDIAKFNAQFRYRYWHSEFTNSKPSNLLIGFMDKYLSKVSNRIKGKIEDAVFG